MKHLDDNSVQEYLDHNMPPGEISAVEEHLTSCAGCREVVERYRTVLEGLSIDQGYDLSPGFATATANRVQAVESSTSDSPWFMIVAAMGFVALAVFSHLYFDLSPLYRVLGSFFAAQSEALQQAGERLGGHLSTYSAHVRILGFAALAMLMVASLDYVVKAMRRGRTMFFA